MSFTNKVKIGTFICQRVRAVGQGRARQLWNKQHGDGVCDGEFFTDSGLGRPRTRQHCTQSLNDGRGWIMTSIVYD